MDPSYCMFGASGVWFRALSTGDSAAFEYECAGIYFACFEPQILAKSKHCGLTFNYYIYPLSQYNKIDASLDPATSNGLNLKPSCFPLVVPDQTLHRTIGCELDGLLVAHGAGTGPLGT